CHLVHFNMLGNGGVCGDELGVGIGGELHEGTRAVLLRHRGPDPGILDLDLCVSTRGKREREGGGSGQLDDRGHYILLNRIFHEDCVQRVQRPPRPTAERSNSLLARQQCDGRSRRRVTAGGGGVTMAMTLSLSMSAARGITRGCPMCMTVPGWGRICR